MTPDVLLNVSKHSCIRPFVAGQRQCKSLLGTDKAPDVGRLLGKFTCSRRDETVVAASHEAIVPCGAPHIGLQVLPLASTAANRK